MDKLEEEFAEAIYDFLEERFPGGALPGGTQIFADDHLDAEFKHEAGCDALAERLAVIARKREEALHEQLAETQMLAFKWMEAHDKLQAGKPYDFPKPADLPDARKQVEELTEGIENAYRKGADVAVFIANQRQNPQPPTPRQLDGLADFIVSVRAALHRKGVEPK